MRKLCMAIAMLCALATATSLAAAERAEFQISPRAGRGVLKLDQFRHVNDNLAEMDTGGLGVAFGVLTPVGLLLEGDTASTTSRSVSSSSWATAGICCRSSAAPSGSSPASKASCCCTTTTSSAATRISGKSASASA
ncbi:MAG TPA: hypothetical protein VN705_04970 [Steroidobacteraceae bacterium]|nr:hypothetical protein [Steroidobacteraceae bacterium]